MQTRRLLVLGSATLGGTALLYQKKLSLSEGRDHLFSMAEKIVCQGKLQYWDGVSKPFFYMTSSLIPPGEEQMFKITSLDFSMYDMRTLAASTELSLETSGFEFHRHTTALAPVDFLDASKVTGAYYEEMRQLLQAKVPGAKRVIIFDHNVRAANLELFTETNRYAREGQEDKVSVTGPVRFAHNDYTHKSGPLRVLALTKPRGSGGSYTVSDKPLLSEADAQQLLKKRFAVVQAWRPINKPVKDCPLAILDARSIKEQDLVESTLVYPDRSETRLIETEEHT